MNIKQKLFFIYFLMLPFIDLTTSLFTRFDIATFTPGMIVKGFTLLFCLVYVFAFSKSKYKKISKIYYVILIFYILLYLLLKKDVWTTSYLLKEARYGYRYFYFPFVFLGFLNIADDIKIDSLLIKKIISYNVLIYASLIILPYLTNTGFNSYYDSYHFKGSVGWFFAANEIGAILTILSVSIYYFLDNTKKYKVLLLIPIFASLTILGTKVGFLGMVVVYFICIIVFIINERKKSFLLVFISFCFLSCTFYFSPISNNVKSIMNNYFPSKENKSNDKTTVEEKTNLDDKKNETIEDSNANHEDKVNENSGSNKNDTNASSDKNSSEIIDKNLESNTNDKGVIKINTFKKLEDYIKNEKINKFITLIFNGRNFTLEKNVNYYLYSGSVNQLFGLSWNDEKILNTSKNMRLMEIDYFDILFHYGFIGFIIYFFPLFIFLIYTIKNIKYIKSETYVYLFTILAILFAALLAGHVFSAPSVSIYLILLMYISIFEIDLNKRKKKEA